LPVARSVTRRFHVARAYLGCCMIAVIAAGSDAEAGAATPPPAGIIASRDASAASATGFIRPVMRSAFAAGKFAPARNPELFWSIFGCVMQVPDDVRRALEAYRSEPSAARWTTLSQLWVGDLQVLDVLQKADPNFPDPLPLPIDGIPEDNTDFFQWSILPEPDEVKRALDAVEA